MSCGDQAMEAGDGRTRLDPAIGGRGFGRLLLREEDGAASQRESTGD